MPFPLIPFLVTAATWLGRIGLAAFAINEIKKLTSEQKSTIETHTNQAEAEGLSEEELSKMVAATTYEQVEKDGKKPDDFWKGLSPAEQAQLKWSPEVLRQSMNRTTFLGLAQTILWIAAGVAGGVAAFRGLPASLAGLAKISAIPRTAKNATVIANELQIMKTAILNKTWVPGTVAGIAAAGGWLTGGLTNNLNDALLWGRIFLDQAHEDVKKAALQKGGGVSSGVASTPEQTPRTRITISKTSEPKVAVGTLYQGIVKTTDAFKRVVDDEITSADDLKNDVILNLNHWLATLPGRLHYEVRRVLNPLDDFGNKRLGTWYVLMLGHRNSQGVFQHLQAILLGPTDTTKYNVTTREVETIQVDIPKLLTSEEIINLDLPTTGLRTIDKQGNVYPLTFGAQSPTTGGIAETPESETKETPTPVGESVPPGWISIAAEDDVPAGEAEEIKRFNGQLYYKPKPKPLTPAQQVQQGKLTPYIRFENNDNIYARLTGRKVPYNEAVNSGYFANNLVQDRPINELDAFLNGFKAVEQPRPVPPPPPPPAPPLVTYTPPTPAQPSFTPAPPKKPYVQYLGSPNIFERNSGRYIAEQEAKDKNIFSLGLIEFFTTPRPEVKVASDFAVWNNRNLTQLPV